MAFLQKCGWFIGLLTLFVEIGFYQPPPTHNPFDDVYHVSRERLSDDGYEENQIDFYFYYTKWLHPRLRVDYGFFGRDPWVTYKGMTLVLTDTLIVEENLSEDQLDKFKADQLRAWLTKPAHWEHVRQELAQFDVKLLELDSGTLVQTNDHSYWRMATYIPSGKVVDINVVSHECEGKKNPKCFTLACTYVAHTSEEEHHWTKGFYEKLGEWWYALMKLLHLTD
ncbi:MAG: hypothetical protein MUC97_11455 [Bernardetiaceae bacterium]|jgi:hypothetical protein|nr:hypothetical protein [Bernardetiaceae bacterium]